MIELSWSNEVALVHETTSTFLAYLSEIWKVKVKTRIVVVSPTIMIRKMRETKNEKKLVILKVI